MKIRKKNNKKIKKKWYTIDISSKRVLKKGARELYPFVYMKTWDLTQYDTATLAKYDLKPAKYVYVGSSGAYNMNERTSKFINGYRKRGTIANNIIKFLDNLLLFYFYETDIDNMDLVSEVFYNNVEVVARCESIKGARAIERAYTTHYHNLDIHQDTLDTQIILLSKVDSSFREKQENAINYLVER